MRVLIKKTEEEVRRELFGPIQEASRELYQLHVDPRKTWCELSELRLSILLCQFKPVGYNRNFHLLAIVEHMCKIYDNEHAQSEIFLSDEDKVTFRNQQRQVLMGACRESEKRLTFPPTYLCRPSLEVIEKKIGEWYGLDKCEENESVPEFMERRAEYQLPESVIDKEERLEIEAKYAKETSKNSKGTPASSNGRDDSGSPVVAPPEKKKKKKRIVEDD